MVNYVSDAHDSLWSEVTTQLDTMNTKVGEFALACSKMPKDLRQWDAYTELKLTIDQFKEALPLVQSLAHPSMRPRHWTALMAVTGRHLAIGTSTLKLRDVG